MKKLAVCLLGLLLAPFASAVLATDGEIVEGAEGTHGITGVAGLTCTIRDAQGNPITTASTGDVVYLEIMHPATMGANRGFIFAVPSNAPSLYKDLFYYSKEYSGASSGAVVGMKIQEFSYVGGIGYFIGTMSGYSPCWAALQVIEAGL